MKQLRRSTMFLIISHLVLPAYSSQKHPGEDQQNPRSSKRARHAQQVPTQAQLNRQLLSAAKKGNAQEVRSLIQSGADKEATDGLGRRSLHYAALKGHLAIIDILLLMQADTQARDLVGMTPVHYAACRYSALAPFIRAGADLNTTNREGQTPLHMAAMCENSGTIVPLIQAGSNIDARNNCGETPLLRAIRNGLFYAVETLMRCGADKEITDNIGDTPLQSIAGTILSDVLRAHRNQESYDENIEDQGDEDTDIAMIRYLIENGANIMAQNQCDQIILPEVLCRAYAKLNDGRARKMLKNLIHDLMGWYEKDNRLITDDNGNTLLHLVFLRASKVEPSIEAPNVFKRFVCACLRKYRRHIASNTKNMDGLAPQHIAAKNPLFVRQLTCEYGADPRATTPCGDTVTSLACKWTNLTPQPDWTPLMRAVHHVTSSNATALQTVQSALDHCDNPEFITAQHHSALSVAQCPEVKTVIRKHILTTRRQKISEYLQTNHNQPAVLANLQLQFAGTYEPQA